MMRTIKIAGWIMAVALSALTARGEVIDTFENGDVKNSDNEAGFWTTKVYRGGSAAEADGKLTLTTAHGKEEQRRFADVFMSEVNPNWDFFSQPVTFSADINLGGTTENTSRRQFRFYVISEGGELKFASDADDYFRFMILQEFKIYFVTRKDGKPETLGAVDYTDKASRFALTLDEKNYRLDVTNTDGETTTLTGPHELERNAWNAKGACAGFSAYKETFGKNNKGAGRATITVDNFKVYSNFVLK